LRYPLNDLTRQPIPAGGLFSTATDIGHFAQLFLNGGVFEGKRLLSERAIKQMIVKQTPDTSNQGNGLGFRTNGTVYGHFGHYGTDFSIDSKRGLAFVYLIQNAGWRNEEGSKIHPAFHRAALDAFGKKS
jgi:CubicO group peptidase (beta-lactamase class C family)